MIAFRYRLKNVPMKIAEQSFTAEGVKFPAGSFIITGSPADLQAARAAVESLGLTAAALSRVPTVATHDADVPRVAIYSQWSGTQELGLVSPRVRPVRHSVRSDLQGARREGQSEERLRRHPHGGAERQSRRGARAAGRQAAALSED